MRTFEAESDVLIRRLTLKRYPKRIERLAREELHCDGAFDKAGITRSLTPLRGYLQDFQGDRKYLIDVASAYVSVCRQIRGKSWAYRERFEAARATPDELGDLMPMTALSPAGDIPSKRDMMRLVSTMRWLTAAHRPRLERAAGLTMLPRSGAWGLEYLAKRTTSNLEKTLCPGDMRRWNGLILGSEYWHVEMSLSTSNFKYSPDGQWLRMMHGRFGPLHWQRRYSYWELARLAERVATWDAGWVLGRIVETVEVEVHTRAAAIDGAQERRSGVDMVRYPWLFDENGNYKPSPLDARSVRTAAAHMDSVLVSSG
jgi:hypothetical protein